MNGTLDAMNKTTTGIYYLGRVVKLGVIDNEKLIQALLRPIPIHHYKHSWTFIDVKVFNTPESNFVYGRLSKYLPDGEVLVVDHAKGEEISQEEPNLSVASSPFVYIPEYSGIAFLRVPAGIEPITFMDRFPKIINNTYGNFFVDCSIKPISDLQTFASKLSKLSGVYKISANVSPPNPLFGPLWESLKEYLANRRTNKLTIQEDSVIGEYLNTDLPNHIMKVATQTEDKPYLPAPLPIGDAAILMAADGYGTGFVKGKQQDEIVTIRTSETIKNFSFSKSPEPVELFNKANQILKNIKTDRHMRH
jgi:hypothetical protein